MFGIVFLMLACAPILTLSAAPTPVVSHYFAELETLKSAERWEEIISLGEDALTEGRKESCMTPEQEFAIIDQLVSTYFRLGNFEKAKQRAKFLLVIGSTLRDQPALVVDSLYKCSAAIRGEAGSISHPEQRRKLFVDARRFARHALELCNASCSTHDALKARVLFNAGAAECDDLEGDYSAGISMYEKALILFTALKEEDYQQRTLLRLGKAYLLQGDIHKSRQIVETFQYLEPEQRTRMHFYYLKAQLLMVEGLCEEAEQVARDGMEMAIKLHAQADAHRFEQLIHSKRERL